MDTNLPMPQKSKEDDLPVFLHSGWAEAARGDKNLVVKSVYSNGVELGRVSYIVKPYHRRLPFLRVGGNPFWTPYSGVALNPTLTEGEKLAVARELIAQLPKKLSFHFQCPCHTPEAPIIRQAFVEAGFFITGSGTRILKPSEPGIFTSAAKSASDASSDILAILDPSVTPETGQSIGKTRTQIRKAAKELEVKPLSASEFVRVYGENLRRENKTSREPLPVLEKVLDYALKTGNVRIFAACQKTPEASKQETVDAAIACAWDKDRYYVWRMTVRKPTEHENNKPHQHAAKLVLVHAMRDARLKGLVFDTEGGGDGQTKVLYPRLRINGEEDRIIAARYNWTISAVYVAKRAVKKGIRVWKNIKRRHASPA